MNEAIVPDAGFVSNVQAILMARGKRIGLSFLERDENSFPSMKDVTSLITRESRVMFVNSSYNLSSSMLSYGDAIWLLEIIVKRDMVVISDGIHEGLLTIITRLFRWLEWGL